MTDLEIAKRQNLLEQLYRQCSDVLRLLPREELFNLASDYVEGFEMQQASGKYPQETILEYAVGCTRHRFQHLLAA